MLGDRFLIPRLQNAAIAQIHNRLKNGTSNNQLIPFAKQVCAIQEGHFELTDLLEWYLGWCSSTVFDSIEDNLSESFVRRMVRIFRKQRGREGRFRGAGEFFKDIR